MRTFCNSDLGEFFFFFSDKEILRTSTGKENAFIAHAGSFNRLRDVYTSSLIIRSVPFCLKPRRGADIFYQKDRQFSSPDNSRLWIPGGSPCTGILSPEIRATAVYFLNLRVVFKVLPAGPALTVTCVIVILLDLRENTR